MGPEPLRRNEISEVITRVLIANGFFPAAARPWSKGKTVYEGHILERFPNGTIRLWSQRANAIEPHLLAEQNHHDFAKLHEAIDSLIDREWPDHTIDGIAFVD